MITVYISRITDNYDIEDDCQISVYPEISYFPDDVFQQLKEWILEAGDQNTAIITLSPIVLNAIEVIVQQLRKDKRVDVSFIVTNGNEQTVYKENEIDKIYFLMAKAFQTLENLSWEQ